MCMIHGPPKNERIEADVVTEGEPARTARVSIKDGGDHYRFVDVQDSIVVSLEQAIFCG